MKHLKKFEGFAYNSEKKQDDCCPECGCEMKGDSCPECETEVNERKKASKKKEEFNFSKKGKKKEEEKEEKDTKGKGEGKLTSAQKRLPAGLRAAIAKKAK